MIRVVGVGAGGHAKVVIELLREIGGFEVAVLLDARAELKGTSVLGVPVIGGDGLLPQLRTTEGIEYAFIGVGGTGDMAPRRRLYDTLLIQGYEIVRALHPAARISPSATIGEGPTIMAGAIVNALVTIGDDVIINTGAIVEHDCVIESHVHIATGALLSGGVTIGEGAHVGVGASIRQGVKVGKRSIVGAGAAVVGDVPDGVVVVGVPARVLKQVGGE